MSYLTSHNVLRELLPPVFLRKQISALSHGLLNGRTIANLQSKRCGPPSFRVGNHVAFERESFLYWLEMRSVARGNPKEKVNNFSDAMEVSNEPALQ